MSLTALRRAVSAARTESGEKAAVAKILSAAGHRKQPHVQSHRNGRNVVRTYLWRDTPMGSLVLVTGPSVDGQVHRVEKVTGDVSADDVTCYVPKQGRTPAYAAFKPGRGPRGRQSRQKRPRASQGRRNPFSFAAFKAAAEDEFAQGGTGVVSSYEEETARPLSELDAGCPSASRAPVYGVLYDANGRKYRVLYRAIQTRTDGAGPLLPSNTPEFEESPGYPVEFQARSLSRPGEQAKIRKIARELDPNRLLLPHADPTFGAPVVWEGNGERDTQRGTYYVLGGNSRTIALMRAPEDRYRAYAEQAARLWPDVWPDEPAPDGFRTVIVRQAFPDDCPTMQDARALNKACQMPFGRAQALAGATQRSMAGEEDPLGEALSLVRGLGIPQDRLAAALGSVDWRTIVDRTNVAEFLAAHRSLVDTLRGIMGSERYNTALAGVPEIAAKTVNALLIGFLPRSVIEQGFGNDREERAVLASLPMMVSLATGVERGDVPASWALLPHMEEARAFADKFRGKPYGQIASAVQAAFKQQSLGLLSGGGQKVEALLKGMSPLGILLGMVFVRAERLRDPLYAIEDTLQPYVEAAFEVESKYDTGKATGQGGLFGAGIGAKPTLPPGLAVKTLGDLVSDKVSAQARAAWKAVIDVLVERAKAAPAPVAAPAPAPAAADHPEHDYWLSGLGKEAREAWTALLDAVAEAEALPSTLHKRVKFSPADVTQRARQDFLAPAQRGDANRFNPQGVRDEAERIVARIEDARDLSAMWSESEAAPAPEPDLFGGTPAPAPAPAPVEVQWTEITALNRDPGGLRITSRGDENVYIDVPTVGSVFVKVPDPDTFTLDDPGAQFREPEPAAADLSPIPYAYNMPPGLVQPAQIDPDTYYMLWEQSPSGGWVQERSYRGQYILDALADELRQKATTSRPMIVMPMGDVPEPVRAAAPTRPASKPDDGFVARGWPMGWDGSSNHARRLLIARVAHPSDLNESRLETAMESETPEKRLAIVGYLDEIARQGVVTNEIVDLAERIKADYDAEDAEYEVPAAPAETGMGLNPFRGPGAPALLTVNGKPVRLPVRGYAVASFEGEVREIARDSLYHAEMDKEEVQSYFLLDALFDYGKSTLSLPADPALGRLLLDGLNNLSNAEYATGEEADDPASRRHARAASQGLTTLVLKATEAYVKAGVDLDKPAGPPPGSLTARAEALADKIEALYADAEAATRFPALRVGVTSKVIDADTLRKRIPVISKADLEGFEADYKSGVKALVALREREALRAGEAERALPRMTLPVPDKPAEREMTPLQKQIAKMLGYKRNPRRLRRNPALSDRGRAAITRILTEQKGANAREADRVLTELDAVAIALDAEPAEFVRRVLAALDAVLSTVRQAEQDEIDRLLEEAAGGAAPAPAAPAPAPAPEPEEADWRPSSPINQHFIAGKVAAALGQRGWRAEAKGEGSPTTPGQMTVNAHGFGDSSVSSAQSVLINRDSEFGFTLTVRATNVTRYITEPEALDNVVDAFASFVADTLTDDNLYPTSEAAREAELEAMLAPSAPAPAPAPAPQPAPAPSSAVPPYDIEDRTRKSGAPYVVLIPLERVSKAEWKRRIESAKRAGSQRGWKGAWGNKRGGYPFDTREQAEAWWFSYFGAEAPEAAPAAPGVVQVMSLVSDALYRWYTEAAKESDDKGVLAVAGYGFDGAEKSVGFRFQRTAPGDDAFMVITPTGDLRSGLTRTLDEAKATADDLAETIERSLREANVYPTSAAAREAELEAMLGGPAATTPEPEPEPDVVIFRFPSLNKMNTLTGYLGQPDEDWKQTRGVVEEVVNVTPARWMEIAANLLDDIPEIAKTGGTGSTYDPYPGDDSKGWGDFTEKQRQRWMDESYRQVTAIFAPGKPPIYTDPQGYNYARYVGFLPSAGQSVEDIRALYRKALGVGPEPAPTPAPAGPSASTLVTEAVTEAVGAAQGSGRRVVPTGATSPSPSPAAPPAPAPADDKAAALAALFADV